MTNSKSILRLRLGLPALLAGLCLCSGNLQAQDRDRAERYVLSLVTKPHLTLEEVERAETIAQLDRSISWWAKKVRASYEEQQQRAAAAAAEKQELKKVPQVCIASEQGDQQLEEALRRDDAIAEISRQGDAGNASDACSLIATTAEKLETDRKALVDCAKTIESLSAKSLTINDYRKGRLFRASAVHSAEENLNQLADQYKCAD